MIQMYSLKVPTYNFKRERAGNTMDWLRKESNESRNKYSPYTKCQRHSWKADERVDVRTTSCSLDGKLTLKVDEPKVEQWQECIERKWEYYHIIYQNGFRNDGSSLDKKFRRKRITEMKGEGRRTIQLLEIGENIGS